MAGDQTCGGCPGQICRQQRRETRLRWISISIGLLSAVLIVADIYLLGYREHVKIMEAVWPLKFAAKTGAVGRGRSQTVAALSLELGLGLASASKPTITGNDTTGVGAVDGSLYDRLGGTDAIMAVTRAFEQRSGMDDRINQKFARTDLDRLAKEFVDLVCRDTSGPCSYTGRNMTEAHRNMAVTNAEFDVFLENLAATMDDFHVGKTEQGELMNKLMTMRGEIVEVDSSQTGTALPAAFDPAPSLS